MVRRTPVSRNKYYEEQGEIHYGSSSTDTNVLSEDVEKKMEEARDRLDLLRSEQEKVQQEERKLERLRVRQEEFLDGSKRIHEQLQRAGAKLDRDLLDKERQIEAIRTAKDTISRHLDSIRGLAPERWHDDSLEEELDNALIILEDAELDFERCSSHLSSIGTNVLSNNGLGSSQGGWLFSMGAITCLKTGFFFFLPLVAGLFATALVVLQLIK